MEIIRHDYIQYKKRKMEEPKVYQYLTVFGRVYFDDNYCFCGWPYVYLVAYKEDNPFVKKNEIEIAIHDDDDYDVGFVYYPDQDNFSNVLHELINWINDLEHEVCSYDTYISDIEGFFPDCRCERER